MNSVVAIQRTPNWREGLMVNSRGTPLGNLRNVLHALRHAAEWRGVLAYDEFHKRVCTLKPPPWSESVVEKWMDTQDNRACEWIQEQEIPAAVGTVGRAVHTVALENPVHPVRDYLNGLKWDGTQRLDNWLTTYLGVEATPYVGAVGPRFLISAVARIFEPGCQVDHVLILEGPQGKLKSTALRTLADPWFTDRISKVGTKDSAVEVAGVWLVEVSELDALTKVSNSAIKSFVTRRADRYRPPYGRHLVDQPRQCVFAGTINPVGGYLKDPTGARRFWPVTCDVIDVETLRRDRDQLFAEAVVRYRARAPWWLADDLEVLAMTEQQARYEVDAWSDQVTKWLADRDDVSIGEVLVGALGISKEKWTQSAQNRVAEILTVNGFTQYRPGKKGHPRTPRYRREATGRPIEFKEKADRPNPDDPDGGKA